MRERGSQRKREAREAVRINFRWAAKVHRAQRVEERGEGAGDGPMKRMTMCPRESEAVDRRQRGVDRKEEGSI